MMKVGFWSDFTFYTVNMYNSELQDWPKSFFELSCQVSMYYTGCYINTRNVEKGYMEPL